MATPGVGFAFGAGPDIRQFYGTYVVRLGSGSDVIRVEVTGSFSNLSPLPSDAPFSGLPNSGSGLFPAGLLLFPPTPQGTVPHQSQTRPASTSLGFEGYSSSERRYFERFPPTEPSLFTPVRPFLETPQRPPRFHPYARPGGAPPTPPPRSPTSTPSSSFGSPSMPHCRHCGIWRATPGMTDGELLCAPCRAQLFPASRPNL